ALRNPASAPATPSGPAHGGSARLSGARRGRASAGGPWSRSPLRRGTRAVTRPGDVWTLTYRIFGQCDGNDAELCGLHALRLPEGARGARARRSAARGMPEVRLGARLQVQRRALRADLRRPGEPLAAPVPALACSERDPQQ